MVKLWFNVSLRLFLLSFSWHHIPPLSHLIIWSSWIHIVTPEMLFYLFNCHPAQVGWVFLVKSGKTVHVKPVILLNISIIPVAYCSPSKWVTFYILAPHNRGPVIILGAEKKERTRRRNLWKALLPLVDCLFTRRKQKIIPFSFFFLQCAFFLPFSVKGIVLPVINVLLTA